MPNRVDGLLRTGFALGWRGRAFRGGRDLVVFLAEFGFEALAEWAPAAHERFEPGRGVGGVGDRRGFDGFGFGRLGTAYRPLPLAGSRMILGNRVKVAARNRVEGPATNPEPSDHFSQPDVLDHVLGEVGTSEPSVAHLDQAPAEAVALPLRVQRVALYQEVASNPEGFEYPGIGLDLRRRVKVSHKLSEGRVTCPLGGEEANFD